MEPINQTYNHHMFAIRNTVENFKNACIKGDLKEVKILYGKHKNVLESGEVEMLPYASSLEIGEWLYSLNQNVNIETFMDTCVNGNLIVAQFLHLKKPTIITEAINKKCCIDRWIQKVTINVYWIFIKVCRRGFVDVAKWLKYICPDLKIDEHAFCAACANGRLEMAKELLLMEPNIHIHFSVSDFEYEESAFFRAVSRGHIHVANWLISLEPTHGKIEIDNIMNLFDILKDKRLNTAYDWFSELVKNRLTNEQQ